MGDWRLRQGTQEISLGEVDDVQAWVRDGRLGPDDAIYHPLLDRWIAARQAPELVFSASAVRRSTATGVITPPRNQGKLRWRAFLSAIVVVAMSSAAVVFRTMEKPVATPSLASSPTTATAVAEPVSPATVAISPEVLSLTADDPDLQVKLTPEEVKATLASAAPPAASTAGTPASPPRVGASEWQAASEAQAKRDSEYKARMAMPVHSDRQGGYHAAGCAALWDERYDARTQRMVRVYIGNQITLNHARSENLRRHDACAPPSYEYKY